MKVIRETALCLFGVLVSVLLRICTSLHPYSGQGTPPMYGDYEAQRHWMEITVNLPINQWYYNSTDNDLMYWGLDYPPLTAYHMYLCGLVAKYLNPEYVRLFNSRGYESESHKLFMRYTVLIVDVLIFFPAVILYFHCTKYQHLQHDVLGLKKKERDPNIRRISAHLSIILALIYPGLILIDHGHFQYNCISLGFMVFAVAFLSMNRHILASIFFCLSLNYKQMELYHAFPFFLYLLSSCVPKPGTSLFSGCFKFLKISLTVLIMFVIIWSPFLSDIKNVLQVLHRLFPVSRGVFEDKVSNIWCAINAAIKLKQRYCNDEMLRICMATTLTTILPSSIDLFVRPNVKKFVPALINSSLAFYLFSFQVHEKSILLVTIPVLLYLPNKPIACFWFLTISTFSMFPLFMKDHLVIAFYALVLFYVVSFKMVFNYTNVEAEYSTKLKNFMKDLLSVSDRGQDYLEVIQKHVRFLKSSILYAALYISLLTGVVLTALPSIFDPPEQYSDLYPFIISVYCCVHFLMFFVYFNYVQLRVPQGFEHVGNVKLKTS